LGVGGIGGRGRSVGTDCGAVGELPNAEDAVFATGDDEVTIGGGGDGVHIVAGTTEGPDLIAVIGIVEADGAVTTTTDDGVGASDELYGGDLLAVTGNGPNLLSGVEAPDFDGVVGTDAGNDDAVASETGIEDVAGVAFEGLNESSSRDIEDFNKLVGGAADDHGAVERVFEAEDDVAVGVLEFADAFAFGYVPNHQFTTAGRITTAGCEELAVGAEGKSGDAIGEDGGAELAFGLGTETTDEFPGGIESPGTGGLIGGDADEIKACSPGDACNGCGIPGDDVQGIAVSRVGVDEIVFATDSEVFSVAGEGDGFEGFLRGGGSGLRGAELFGHLLLRFLGFRDDGFGLFEKSESVLHGLGGGFGTTFGGGFIIGRSFHYGLGIGHDLVGVGLGFFQGFIVFLGVESLLGFLGLGHGFLELGFGFGEGLLGGGLGFVGLGLTFFTGFLFGFGGFDTGFGSGNTGFGISIVGGQFGEIALSTDIAFKLDELLAVGVVPELDGIAGDGGDLQAVGSEREGNDGGTVIHRTDGGTAIDVPDTDLTIGGTGNDFRSGGTGEGEGGDGLRGAGDGFTGGEGTIVGELPDLNLIIGAVRGE